MGVDGGDWECNIALVLIVLHRKNADRAVSTQGAPHPVLRQLVCAEHSERTLASRTRTGDSLMTPHGTHTRVTGDDHIVRLQRTASA